MPSLIGNKPNQVPSNGDLGTLAFQDSNAVNLTGGTAVIDNLTADAINLKVDTDISNIAPSLNLDFANSKTLDPRITYTRASTATYYDGVTTAKAEENLIIRSEEFDNAIWTKTNVSVTANSTAAPNGTTTAELIDDGLVNDYHGLQYTIVTQANTNYVISFYAKDVDRQYVSAGVWQAVSVWAAAVFDLTAGTVAYSNATGTGYLVNSTSITSVGSGWYRCSVSLTVGSASATRAVIGLASSATLTAYGLHLYTGSNKQAYFWGAQLEQRSAVSAYTPTTTQAITNYIPALQTAASGVARFEHNPTTGESLGLLIEEARTNFISYSDDFSNAAWTKLNSTITSNSIIAPDGTLTGDLITATTSSGYYTYRSNTTGTSTLSMYMKAGTSSVGGLYVTGGTNCNAQFNLSTGTVISILNGTATITHVGNGWYRCSITYTAVSGNCGFYVITATSGDSVYIWGAQVEAGAFATSYIPTVASQVTRAADAASMTGTNFSSWYNQQEGTVYVNGSPVSGASLYIDAYNFSTTSIVRTQLTAQSCNLYILGNGVTLAGFTFGSQTIPIKSAITYKVNDFAGTTNAATVQTDTSGTVPNNVNTLFLGKNSFNSAASYAGTISKITYFPKRLTNNEIQEMTA